MIAVIIYQFLKWIFRNSYTGVLHYPFVLHLSPSFSSKKYIKMNSFHQLYQMQMHQIHLPIHPRILEGNPLTQRVEPETAKKTKTKATKTTKGASCGGSILDYVLGPHPIRGRIEKVQQSAELKNVERPFLFKRHPKKKKVKGPRKGTPKQNHRN